jgi:hypothetical protein
MADLTRQTIASFLKEVSEIPNRKERIQYLAENGNNGALKLVLQYMFDPRLKFLLPKGPAPYTPSPVKNPKRFYPEARKLYLFVEGGNPHLQPARRERIFIDLLETIDQDEAEMLIAVKDKICPFEGITKKVVQEAFPGLLPT